jgi:hypothetical protein
MRHEQLNLGAGQNPSHHSVRPGSRNLVGRVVLRRDRRSVSAWRSRGCTSTACLQRLLKLCSLTDTLIIDGDGV